MSKKLNISGRVVLITGGGQGIGRELVRETLERGGVPIVVEYNSDLEDAIRARIGDRGAVHFADVRDAAAMEKVVEETVKDFGRLDVVLANAGIERLAPIWEMPREDFEAVLDVNVLGAYRTIKPALPHVMKAGGHLLTISSLAAVVPVPFGAAYSASKAAVDMMMRVIRIELLDTGVTAGAAYFGVIPTQMGARVAENELVNSVLKRLPGRLIGNTPAPTAATAACKIMDGVEQRRARVYAPWAIRVTYLMRGFYAQAGDFQTRRLLGVPKLVRERFGLRPGGVD